MHNDEGFREIQLNGKQLVFLFMAATVVSVVIFLCGVLVGRGVRGGAESADAAAAEITADAGCRAAFRGAPPAPSTGGNAAESKPEAAAGRRVELPGPPAPRHPGRGKAQGGASGRRRIAGTCTSADRSGARGSAATRTSSGPSSAGSRTSGGGSIECESSRARPIRPRLCGAGQHFGDASRGRSTGAPTGRQGLSCIRRRSRQRHAKADLPNPRRQIPEQERG